MREARNNRDPVVVLMPDVMPKTIPQYSSDLALLEVGDQIGGDQAWSLLSADDRFKGRPYVMLAG